MKAVIIARVSTEEQREAGLSLPAQVMRLENYCQNEGFIVIEGFFMKKCIILSLLILSSTFAQAMRKDSSLNQSHESKLISHIRISENNFENQLQGYEPEQKYPFTLSRLFSDYRISFLNLGFLGYCYNQKFHKSNLNFEPRILDSLLKKYQEKIIDGYSALSAAMLAKEISIENKHTFIQELIGYGFKPTPKDIELAELSLYDGIAEHQITMLHLLHTHSQANWSVLPQEVRKQIAQYMMQLFKKEFWLLP